MSKLFYTIHRRGSQYEHYNHIDIRIYKETEYHGTLCNPQSCEMTWQGDKDHEWWYAFRLEFEADSPSKALDHIRIVSRIAGLLNVPNLREDDPMQVVQALEAAKIERRVRDDRSDEYLPLEDVLPPDYSRYMAWVDGSCAVSCVARDEDHAKKLLLKRFAESSDSSWYVESLTKWIKEGQQVRLDGHSLAPDVRSIEEICKPMKEKQQEAIAA